MRDFAMLEITHSSLTTLEQTQAWSNSGFRSMDGISAEEIYGPKGKLTRLWPMQWQDQEEMLSELLQNMGGGVPYDVIVALVQICVEEQGES